MKQFLLLSLVLIFGIIVFAQNADVYTGPTGVTTVSPVLANQQPKLEAPGFVVFDNGPLVTHPGQGFNGADVSALHSGLTTLGAAIQFVDDKRLADDFTFTESTEISSFVFFAYQTYSTIASTITGAYIQIYDRKPDLAGATVIWGNRITNRLSSSTFSGIYRTNSTDLTYTDRPIMRVECNAELVLPAGTYWLEVSIDGTNMLSGPWCPLVTIPGELITGNACKFFLGACSPLNVTYQQGIPFMIIGAPKAVPFNTWYLAIAFLAIAVGLVVKRRFFN